ncbi:titin isoform X2 [Patella vulgata]|uniref:titin isoform X2 n=1 Tax=Patella vulgata TaxID=6465 RepID=UPI0021801EC2|nr:titin isoform X2 [Patella vulgata]
MVGGGTALNLSLLSRGIGEIQQNGHERVEVFLEPEDYFNFVKDPKRIYLPPIQTRCPFIPSPSTASARESKKIDLPKTFTTRRGALLLFSEDLALRNRDRAHKHHVTPLSQSVNATKGLNIKTVDDLAKSILSYGKEQVNESNDVYLGFIHNRRKFHNERQIRPGFSAKRYLSTWTRIWDDTLLENVISKGYITERSLFYGSMAAPHLRRRIFHDDLSHYPAPYRLMRNMLISPGSLSGYTFYRMQIQQLDLLEDEDDYSSEDDLQRNTKPSITVVKTKDGVQREVSYASLDRQSQKEVLTDLLVKSAVNFALQKQHEFVENMKNPSPENIQENDQMEAFDMKEAVESLLETEKEYREFDKLTQNTNQNLTSPHEIQSSWPQDGSSSKVQLPALDRQHLSTIEDVSREGTGMRVLPPIGHGDRVPLLNVAPPTPKDGARDQVTQTSPDEDDEEWGLATTEEAILRKARKESEQKRHLLQQETEGIKDSSSSIVDGPFQAAKFQFASDTESLSSSRNIPIPRPLQKRQWAGSTHSLKSHSSKRGPGSVTGDGSMRGSLICAPGGEVIRIGGSVAHSGSQGDVANLGEVTPRGVPVESKSVYHITDDSDTEEPEAWRSSKSDKKSAGLYGYGKKSITEQSIVNALTEHAQAIAEHILGEGGGIDLEDDIRRAIDTVMKSQRINSAAPTTAEYKEMIKKSITSAVANAAGVDITALNLDADISDELLEALATQNVSPDDVKIVKDPLTGRSQLTTSRTSLKDGHLYIEPNGGNVTDRPVASIPSERSSVKDIGDVDVISYMASETIELAETIKSEKSDRSDTKSKASRSKASSVSSEQDIKSVKSVTEEQQVEERELEQVPDTEVEQPSPEVPDTEVEQPSPEVKPTVAEAEKDEETTPVKSKPASPEEEKKVNTSDHGSAKSRRSSESIRSQDKNKTKPVKLEEREEFVVGKVKEEKENEKLYGRTEPPQGKSSLPKVPRRPTVENAQPPKPTTEPLSVPDQKEEEAPEIIERVPEPEKTSQPAMPEKSEEEPVKPIPKDTKYKSKPKEDPVPKKVPQKEVKKEEPAKKQKPFIPPPGARKEKVKPAPPAKPAPVPETKPDSEPTGKPKEKKAKAPPPPPPKKEEKKKKGKKTKKSKKAEEVASVSPPVAVPVPEDKPSPVKEPTAPVPPKSITPRLDSGVRSDSRSFATPESDGMEFIIIRDRSPTPEPEPESEKAPSPLKPDVTAEPEPAEEKEDSDDENKLNLISNKDARAAKRAAAAAKRREEVDRKRKEREEEAKREREKQERDRQREIEAEDARRRQEEQRRLRKQQEESDRLREELESREREKRRLQEIERDKRLKEERQRKFEEMRRRQLEEEQKRLELLLLRQAEEEELYRLEEEKKSQMEEQERIEYERRMKEEEELRKQKEALEKQRREEEAARLIEEERQKAIAEARKRAELEARLKFTRSLQLESQGLSEHSHQISEAFVFSYYEILQWLGLDIPEFELQKLEQM